MVEHTPSERTWHPKFQKSRGQLGEKLGGQSEFASEVSGVGEHLLSEMGKCRTLAHVKCNLRQPCYAFAVAGVRKRPHTPELDWTIARTASSTSGGPIRVHATASVWLFCLPEYGYPYHARTNKALRRRLHKATPPRPFGLFNYEYCTNLGVYKNRYPQYSSPKWDPLIISDSPSVQHSHGNSDSRNN